MNELGQDQASPLPVFLLTGFLGSGKTTLLNRMIAPGGPAPPSSSTSMATCRSTTT